MTPKLILESTTEPISLEDAALNIREEPDGPFAALIERLVTVARRACEEWTGLSLVQKTLEVSQGSFYPSLIDLPNGPVRSIEMVTYVDSDGVDVVLAVDQYRLVTSDSVARLWPAYGVTLPTARSDVDSVRVRYNVGYPTIDPVQTVPAPILQAMHLLIGHYFANPEAVDVSGLAELPLGVRSLLATYRCGLGV